MRGRSPHNGTSTGIGVSMRVRLFMALVFLLAAPAWSLPGRAPVRTVSVSSSSSMVYAGLSVLSHQAGVASTSATEETKPFLGPLYSGLVLEGQFNVWEDWSFVPVFGMTLFGRKSPEGEEKTSVTILSLRASKPFAESWSFHVGPGFKTYTIKGTGETVQQKNGSSTSTFGTPDDVRSSSTWMIDTGISYQFEPYRAEFSLLLAEPLHSKKQTLSPWLAVTMGVW